MYCQYCGKEIPEDSDFCSHCGKIIGNQEEVSQQKPTKKKSVFAAQFTSIYSIAFGGIASIGIIGSSDINYMSILLCLALITLGIITLVNVRKKPSSEKGMMITLLVIYSIFEIVSLLFLLTNIGLFLIYQAVVVAPFIFSILYLIRLSQENQTSPPPSDQELI
ncbi:MAG TPA: zinc ribbon domain-containing protein [Candidatus Izemoplasmatales bacterium]|nr:zinc ribbon domain-containing protein [Candidatus Izemoplasmatales bacterium]